jgi:hypothetical protein
MLALLPMLLLIALGRSVDAQQGQPVPACALPGRIFTCRNCTGRSPAALLPST